MVEDDAAVRQLLTIVLQASGYGVATVPNGEEAIAYLGAHDPPCAIVLDLEMPVMNGWDFRQWHQRHPQLASIPVIIMSGARAGQRTYELLRPAAYLEKPFAFDRLLTALHTKTACERFAPP